MTEDFDFINNIVENEMMKANDANINESEQKKRGRPRKVVETTSSEEEQPKKTGRPIAEWRHGPDGKYNSHPSDPDYYKKFFKLHHQKPWTCDVCGKTLTTCGPATYKHKKSLHCQLVKLQKQQQTTQTN